jgi:hypothetical protein
MKNKLGLMMAVMVIAGYSQVALAQNLDEGLVAYYPFNGNANDESGKVNHGTVFSAEITDDRNGVSSSAYKVSKGKYIELPPIDDISGDKSRTISIWLKNTNSYRAKPFVYGTLSPGKAFGIVYDNRAGVNKWEFWAHYPDHKIGTVDKEWRLHTITYHNGTITYYIDGLLKKGETNWFGAQPRLNTSKTKIYIGSGISFDPDWSYFDGSVDDVHIYNRALSATDVLALYEKGGSPKTKTPANILYSLIQPVPPGFSMISIPFSYKGNRVSTIFGATSNIVIYDYDYNYGWLLNSYDEDFEEWDTPNHTMSAGTAVWVLNNTQKVKYIKFKGHKPSMWRETHETFIP